MRSETAGSKSNGRQLDRQIQQIISARLKSAEGSKINVEVRNGFVTLKGRVQTFREKERLHRFVMGLHGVRALKDTLKVQPAESIADRKIALHIRQALDAHSELPPGTAVVRVHEGVATLNGHVRTAEERFLAENIASHCRGVTKVINGLTVDPLDEVSDEAAIRAVRGALAYCEELETDGITISCADGIVVLRGEVPSILDRTLAEELARMQCGVRSVENYIQVQPVAKQGVRKGKSTKVKQKA
ncbi:MAG TPA: BON domain-containing protein [Planctomycetota bacterium]|nr:BON domain-containing protein [Planctomycetota bacterium]